MASGRDRTPRSTSAVRRLLLVVGLLVVACLGVSIFIAVSIFNDDRSTYAQTNRVATPEYTAVYEAARQQGAMWVNDASQVALRFLTVGMGDCRITSLNTLYSRPDEAAYVIEERCFDDSIEATRYRVELTRAAGDWQVQWVGSKQKCRRVDFIAGLLGGYLGWTTKPCP